MKLGTYRLLPLLLLLTTACVPTKPPLPNQTAVTPPEAWRDSPTTVGQLPAQWWQTFGDLELTALVEAALRNNTDVLSAVARVDEAREQIRQARSTLLPNLDGQASPQRSRSLGVTGISETTSIQPELRASYEIDVWGRLRNQLAASRYGYQASEAERDSVRLTVASTTARAYITLRSLDLQLRITQETNTSRQRALRVAQDRFDLGYTSELELTQAQSEAESTAQLIPQLENSIRQQENALRLLVGELPSNVNRGKSLAELQLPNVPGTLPSALLRRRPDIAQAEWQLASSDQLLEAQRAAFLPQVQLSAGIGRLYVSSLTYDPVKVWDIGASVLAPIFSGGRLEAQFGVATAQRNQAAFAYRNAVLAAFRDVENALSANNRLAQQIERVRARRDILGRSLAIAEDRYQNGYSSYLEVLDAQRNSFDTELSAVQLRESQLNAAADLYQALGGGWTGRKIR